MSRLSQRLLCVGLGLVGLPSCIEAIRTPPTTTPAVSPLPTTVTYRIFREITVGEGAGTHYRTLPVVRMADKAVESFINSDLSRTFGGPGLVEVTAVPEDALKEMNDSVSTCASSVQTDTFLAIVCSHSFMSVRPELGGGSATMYDLRPHRVRRLEAGDIFTNLEELGRMAAKRAGDMARSRDGEPPDPNPGPLKEFGLSSGGISVNYPRCSFGPCVLGGGTIELTCADLAPFIRADSPWTCGK